MTTEQTAVDNLNNIFGATVSSDIFMKGNSESLFDDLSEDDLSLPEKVTFLKNERVQCMVLNLDENVKFGMVKLEVKILSGDNGSLLTELVFFKPKPNKDTGKIHPQSKKKWVEFLLAFWSKEEIMKGNVDITSPIGKKVEFTAGEARVFNGKTQQDYFNIKVIG